MTPEEATDRFREADQRYRERDFSKAMGILNALEIEFPNDRNLMYAQARTMGKTGREDEALAMCDRLVSEFGYSRAARLQVKLLKAMTEQIDADADAARPLFPEPEQDFDLDSETTERKVRRFKIKPVRLLLLIVLVALTLLKVIHPFVGIGIFVAYFVVKWIFGAVVIKLFTAPFKMKAQALAGATAHVHGVTPVSNPDPALYADEDSDGQELRYVLIDVTVQPREGSGGFTHWEPGELTLAPKSARIEGLDNQDQCFNVLDVKVSNDGVEEDGEGYKYDGPARVKLLVGLPHGTQSYQFVYYTESFGVIQVPE